MGNCLKSCDALGVPVTLNLNKDGTNKTWVGGIFSVLAVLITLLIAAEELYKLSQKSDLNIQVTVEHGDPLLNEEKLQLPKGEVIPAITILNNVGVSNTFEYVRPTFNIVRKTLSLNGEIKIDVEHHPVVECNKIYPEITN